MIKTFKNFNLSSFNFNTIFNKKYIDKKGSLRNQHKENLDKVTKKDEFLIKKKKNDKFEQMQEFDDKLNLTTTVKMKKGEFVAPKLNLKVNLMGINNIMSSQDKEKQEEKKKPKEKEKDPYKENMENISQMFDKEKNENIEKKEEKPLKQKIKTKTLKYITN